MNLQPLKTMLFVAALAFCRSALSAEQATASSDHAFDPTNRWAGVYGTLDNVTLEMSLKPFRKMDEATIARVADRMFQQWLPLTRHAKQVSVLLWTADGSEILDYRGKLDDPIEWAYFIGRANAKYKPGEGPEHLTLHQRPYLYMADPPTLTYGTLKRIVRILKDVGTRVSQRPVRVGATFDPGPEFAKSSFKYQRHPEVCQGATMGKGSFVCCYATLDKDDRAYAGFPDGIPQDTPFGTFFGRQSRHFLDDLGFDYIWFSNGFGFGLETWGATGAVFDGRRFDTGKIAEVRDKILAFWKLFRNECPDVPIETRGTNLATGMDLASDGVDLRSIYRGGFGIAPPPNSPWAALDGDFGLELVGYMSSIAELPGSHYPFRYYTHDPWWLNSPWIDRYGREPHDIYLPMAVARIDASGKVQPASSILFLTVDDSYGRMPDVVPNEVIPHILAGRADRADAPGPVVWVYPFDEIHDWTFGDPPRVDEVLFGDWFMRQAVNNGLPVNTVISTTNLIAAIEATPRLFDASVLLSIVPDAGTELERCLLAHVRKGGNVLLYGPIRHASDELLAMLNLRRAEPLSGEFEVELHASIDTLTVKPYPKRTHHRPLTCAGGIEAVEAPTDRPDVRVGAVVTQGEARRVIATSANHPEWRGGVLAWVRGTNSNFYRKGSRLLATDDPNAWFAGENLARFALGSFGYAFAVTKPTPGHRTPIVCVTRRDNGFFFSGYHANTTVRLGLRFPVGAPLLIGFETNYAKGRTHYVMPRAWHREARVFVDQAEPSELSCVERASVQYGVRRRLRMTGLRNATVRFFPERKDDRLRISAKTKEGKTIKPDRVAGPLGPHVVLRGATGVVTIAW